MRPKAGPVPRVMKPMLEHMQSDGDIVIRPVPTGRYVDHRVVPLREPRLELFTQRELDVVADAIKFAWKATGTALSDWSHGKAWQVAGSNGEAIPYEAAYLSGAPITDYDHVRTLELNRQYEWEPTT
jgi:hypothetical protein